MRSTAHQGTGAEKVLVIDVAEFILLQGDNDVIPIPLGCDHNGTISELIGGVDGVSNELEGGGLHQFFHSTVVVLLRQYEELLDQGVFICW